MKNLILLLLTIVSLSVLAQKKQTTSILGNTFEATYYPSDEKIMVCKKIDLDEDCSSKIIYKNNEYDFFNKLSDFEKKLKKEDFEYKVLDNEKCSYKTLEKGEPKIVVSKIDTTKLNKLEETEIIIKNYPSYFPKLKIKKDKISKFIISSELIEDKIDFTSDNNNINENIEEFYNKLSESLNTNETLKKQILKNYKSAIDEGFKRLFNNIYGKEISKKENYKFLYNSKMYDSDNNSISCNFYYLINEAELSIKVRVENTDIIKIFGVYNINIPEDEFINNLLTQRKLFKEKDDNRNYLKLIYSKLKNKIFSINRNSIYENQRTATINRLIEIENSPHKNNGKLSLNTNVQLYKAIEYCVKKKSNKCKKTKTTYEPIEGLKMSVDSVNVLILNERVDKVLVYAEINGKKITNVNTEYSLPVSSLNKKTQLNYIQLNNKIYWFYYDDLLNQDFLFNSGVKSGKIQLTKEKTSKVVKQKKIGDYFTGVLFSNFLGLNNNLIVAEGRFRFPWYLWKYRKFSMLNNFNIDLSVGILNKVKSNNKSFKEITRNSTLTINNSQLLENRNISAGINFSPFSFEWKEASSYIYVNYGIRFLRSSIIYDEKYTKTTKGTNGNTETQTEVKEQIELDIFSLGHELDLQIELVKGDLVGFNLTSGLLWFNEVGNNIENAKLELINKKGANVKLMANIYALVNSNKNDSGLHLRIGGYYNIQEKNVSHQFMLGYATSLSSFFNKFKAK